MDTNSEENPDPIRFIWNVTPSSKLQQARSVIHPAFHYTPLANPNVARLEYNPLACSCEAVFNKYCPIDYNMKSIRCCFCQNIMPLPANYAKSISPKKLPYELMPENSTFEYKVDHRNQTQKNPNALPASSNKCFLFAIDLCIL